jgi:RNA polymerase sigma factor (sigma-70 family)
VSPTAPLDPPLVRVVRSETWRLVARLTRIVGDVDLAEEIAQDALVAALETWPVTGAPENPGAWLMATAKNRALDALRRKRNAQAREGDVTWHEEALRGASFDDAPDAVHDDKLRLVFVCCHPRLPREQQAALTLRLVCGLTTDEIARAFLAAEPAIAQRIVRAKKTIKDDALPYEVPGGGQLAERLPSVLEVVYLVFNEGYAAATGDALIRKDMCAEALRLGHALAELLPNEPEVLGLVALMEIQSSRADARTGEGGELVLLADQDRTRWDREAIARGLALLARATAAERRGSYVVQAQIAACHARAGSAAETDWRAIALLYEDLGRIAPSPIVEMNRAVAVSLADGPAAGLAVLDGIADHPELARYHLLPSVRADMLRRLGDKQGARAEYARAIALSTNERETAFLTRRLREVS